MPLQKAKSTNLEKITGRRRGELLKTGKQRCKTANKTAKTKIVY
jgi:hypothetical protein